jgi:membrane associated rhomboid family serine protease
VKGLLQQADRTPVTLVVALAYGTLFVLCDPWNEKEFGAQLVHYGWLTPLAAANGEAWRMLSSAFLHGGIVHLLVNLSTLFAIGPAIEQSIGSLRFLLLYVVSALGGSIGVCLFYGLDSPVVGGSGALFGMLGALVAMNMRSGRHLFSFLDFEGPRRLLGLIVVNLVIGFLLPFISNTAHVGGLCAGFLVTFVWLVPGREVTSDLRAWRIAATALFASLLFASVMPATRYDWLWNGSNGASDPNRQAAMRRAAAMSNFGTPSAGEDDVQRFYDEVVAPRNPESPRRGR